MNFMELRDLAYVIEAHTQRIKRSAHATRMWDKKTPYYLHPIWCASAIRFETNLPEEIRINGSQALLYHDILEDTEAELPEWLSQDVKSMVQDLTFTSSEDEWLHLWERDKVTRLLKLYDKTNNIIDGIWMEPERKQQHLTHLRRLCKDVRNNYGELTITRFARILL